MNTLSPSRLAAQASKVLAGAAVGMLAFASFAQSAGAQSSWNPTLLVNTESFQMIDRGDGTTDIELRFGLTTQFIKFLTTNKFQFSHGISVLGTMSGSNLNVDHNATIGGQLTVTGAITGMSRITAKTVLSGQTLRVSGNADVNGSLSVTGSILTEGDLTLGGDDAATNVTLTFMNSGTDETLTWLDTADKFQFSDDVSVVGNLSGSSLRIDGLAEVHGPLAVSGAIRGDGNLTINDDQTAADAVFTFGSDGTNETITWLNTADKFQFSDDVSVVGNLSGSSLRIDGLAEVHGPLAVSGAVRTDSNLTLNDDQTATDVALTFGSDGTNEALTWLNTADKFYLSDDLDVNGTISGTTLKISGNGTHTMSGSLTIESALSGATIEGFGLASCNSTTQKLVYNATTDKFECAADQTGAGSNGSGQIISLHPEYAGAIYFASGASYIGQMTLSGGTTALDNTYRWSSSKGTVQQYWISTRVRLPDNFSSWDPVRPIVLRYKTGVASNANNYVSIRIKDTAGVERPLTGGENLANTAFTTAEITGPQSGGTWTPKGYITIYVKLASDNTTNAYAAAGFINLNFENTLP